MTIDKDAVLALLKQLLLAKPALRASVRESKEELFRLVAHMYVFDEMRRELVFEKEEIREIFDLIAGEGQSESLSSERLKRFYQQIKTSSQELVHQPTFRRAVASALFEAVRSRSC